MTDVATTVHDETMTDTTQPAPDTTTESIHDDETQRLRAELAAAERRLAEEGEKVAQYEAAERARAGTELVAVGDTPDQNTWMYFRQCAHELALATVIPAGLRTSDVDRTAANVLTVILYGHGVGLAPIAAMQLINIIEGKPSISGPGMAALITGRGHSLEFQEEYDDDNKISASICTGTRRDTGASITMRFTREDAVAAGLCSVDPAKPHGVKAEKDGKPKPWQRYTPDMMRWRSLSRVGRMLFGDVLAGIGYTPEELQPDTIDAEGTEVPPADGAPASEPMTSAQRAEMNARVQAMSTDDRKRFFAELKTRFEAGELPAAANLGAEHYLTVVSILDEIAPPDTGVADAVIVLTEKREHDDPPPVWCIEIQLADPSEAQEGDDEPLRTFTDDVVSVGQVVEIEQISWRVVSVCAFDDRPM
jgi:hypothetical protein